MSKWIKGIANAGIIVHDKEQATDHTRITLQVVGPKISVCVILSFEELQACIKNEQFKNQRVNFVPLAPHYLSGGGITFSIYHQESLYVSAFLTDEKDDFYAFSGKCVSIEGISLKELIEAVDSIDFRKSAN